MRSLDTGKAQLSEIFSQGLVDNVCNLCYSWDNARRSRLPTTLSPYLPCICCWKSWHATHLQQLCEIFWLHDHKEVTWKHQKREMLRSLLGICSAGWRDCWNQKQQWFWLGPIRSADCALITLLGPLSAAAWWVAVHRVLEPSPMLLWGDFTPALSPAGSFCLQIPIWLTEVAGDATQYLWSLCWARALLCSAPNSLLWPCFPFSPSGSMEAWAKLYALSPKSSAS
jgi:hypothetical protein